MHRCRYKIQPHTVNFNTGILLAIPSGRVPLTKGMISLLSPPVVWRGAQLMPEVNRGSVGGLVSGAPQ
jgi:hypothetical protein